MGDSLYIVEHKLTPPVVDDQHVPRPRIIQPLLRSKARIHCLVAPGGFGKSIVLRELAEALPHPSAWYNLDPLDDDPVVFWRYTIAAIQRPVPGFGGDILRVLGNSGPTGIQSRHVLAMLLHGLARLEQPLSLVFDNYHVLKEPALVSSLEQLCLLAPEGVWMLLAGRSELNGLGRLLVAGRATKTGSSELAFTETEIHQLTAQLRGTADQRRVAEVAAASGGWPLAVRLLLGRTGPAEPCAPSGEGMLREFLVSEVLADEPLSVQNFMTAISVLDVITPQYCDLLLGRNDSGEVLRSLSSRYFFLTRSAPDREVYRYHHVVRELLSEQLGPARAHFVAQAGRVAAQLGETELAIDYLIASGHPVEARPLIATTAGRLLGRGQWHSVERWLQSLPESELTADPWLTLYRAQVAAMRGDAWASDNWVNSALNGFDVTQDTAGKAAASMLKAKTLRYQGRYQESLDLLDRVAQELPNELKADSSEYVIEHAYTLIMCGRFAQAETVLRTGLDGAERNGDAFLMATYYEGLGNLFFAWGYPDQSLYHYRRAQAISPDNTLRNYYFQDCRGLIYRDWGDPERALAYLTQSMSAKESLGLIESLPGTYLHLGRVLLDLGRISEAEAQLRKGLDAMEHHGGDHLILVLTYISLAACAMIQGRTDEAALALSTATRESTGQSDYITAWFRVTEAVLSLSTGQVRVEYHELKQTASVLEPIGARRLLCMVYALMAVLDITSGEESSLSDNAQRALQLGADMNYIQDFLVSFETWTPLIELALTRGWQAAFLHRILDRAGEPALKLLETLAHHEEPVVRARAASALAYVGGPGATAILNRLSEDGSEVVAAQARYHQPLIRLELLGAPRIHVSGKEITGINWIRRKSRDLLLYLAHLAGPASKERIVEALWPEVLPERGSSLFHAALHNLRRVLASYSGETELWSLRGGKDYLLPVDTSTDLARFQNLLSAAERHQDLSAVDVPLLEEAVALYRGDYLDGLEYGWILPEQELFRQLHNDARSRLSHYYLKNDEIHQAIVHLERLTHHNPLVEDYYRHLLVAYASIGDIQAVNTKYRRLQATLREELGLRPSKEISDLYTDLIGSR